MRSVLLYTAARFAIFLATAAVLALLGARGLLLLALAVLVSGIVSYVLLSGQRDAMSSALVRGVKEQRRRLERARTKEDGGTP
ncbi:hypothetical protein Acsp03_38890 [Actinomadura sp. NBRC 104412]|uniref:DUF4229 domain-containing protein n=1 Tax=Actinomadura sp. NBRC 104412 TaxID=3032203 RepID=UPI0024A55EDF|nr:DUF4229 domain-containing protein [Actinomadura sp. NBRC 104412]GLZ06423.1 hypothetical protein Acsp03_38890 [Actinomadura sp. NBRC 104412]